MLRYIASISLFTALSVSAEDRFQPRLTIEGGLSYVDGLLLPELDMRLNTADQVNFWSLDAAITSRLTDKLNIETGFTFNQERYSEQRQYNFQTSAFYADTQYQYGNGTWGVNLQGNEFKLAGAKFMQQNSLGLYYSALMTDQTLLLVSLTGTDKTLPDFQARNSKIWQTGLNLYYLPASSKSIFSLSLGRARENSQDTFYSNSLYNADLAYRVYLSLFSKSAQLDTGVKYSSKQFAQYEIDNIFRKDRLNEIYSTFGIKLNALLSSAVTLMYSNQNSSLNDFSYQETAIRLSFGITL